MKKYKTTIKNKEEKEIVLTWNDEFELSGCYYSVADIQDYIVYITQKHETLLTNPPIHIYINRINYRLVFKMKDGYKLEL